VQTWKLAYWVTGLNFSPDGSLLAGVELDNFTVHIFQVPSGQKERSLSWTEHASPALYGADFTPDWKTLAWWSRGTVQLMDAATGDLGPSMGHEDFISALAISPDGRLLASAAAGTLGESFQPLIYLWDANSGDLITQLPVEVAVNAMEFSPDGRTLAVLTSDNILRFFEIPQ
jgi:WD40 repeat protein